MGTSLPRPSTSLYSQWLDFLPSINPTSSTLNYEIELPAKTTFTIQPNSLANNAVLTIDGTPHNFDSGGSLSVMIDSGVSHAMAITSPILTSNDTRYLVSWSNAYYSQNANSNTLNVDQDSSITISFQRQFLLTVKSDFGNVAGPGWYNEGSTASFSVSPVQLQYDGFLGSLTLQHQFAGWSGDVVSNVTPASVSMDVPKSVIANWKTVGGPLFLGFVGLIVAITLLAIFLLYRRGTISFDFKLPRTIKKTRKGPRVKRSKTVSEPTYGQMAVVSQETAKVEENTSPTSDKTNMFCSQCGAIIPRSSKFCKECGNKIVG